MQARIVNASSLNVIHDHPASASQPLNAAPVVHAKTFVTVMLAFKAVGARVMRRRMQTARGLRPVDPEEAAGPAHLVAMVDRYSVVYGSPGESIIPRRRAVVEICSGVASEVEALPHTIHMQLICLKRAARVSASADQRPGILISETEISGFRRRKRRWSGLFYSYWLCSGPCSGIYSEPKRCFIPRSGF